MSRYRFGSYDYEPAAPGDSGSVIVAAPRVIGARLRTADAPGTRRQYTAGGIIGPRTFTLSGDLIARGADDIEDLWDAFAAAHAPGLPQALYLDRTDRYLMAEVSTVRDVEAANVVGSIPWEVDFLCQDPLWWGDTLHTVTDATAGASITLDMTPGGTAPALPVYTITFSAVGADITSLVTITNAATGKVSVLWAKQTGAATISDSTAEVLTRSGVDVTSRFLSGPWPELAKGVLNAVTFAGTGGALLTSVSASWRDRWF